MDAFFLAAKENGVLPGPPAPAPTPQPPVPPEQKVMEEAAASMGAAVRFLHAIGFEELIPAVQKLELDLLMLTEMTMIDLERRLGVTPKKAVVALFDECLKLRRCLHRSSAAVDVPQWLPVVLRVPPELVNPMRSDGGAPAPRPRSARAVGARSTASRGRPMTANARLRFMMSGMHPPVPKERKEDVRRQRLLAAQQLAEHRGDPAEPTSEAVVGAPRPPDAPQPPKASPRRLPDSDAANAAEAAKAVVMRLVGEREAAVGALRTLMPTPRGIVARRRATQQLIMTPGPLAEARADVGILLGEVRRTSAAICRAIYEWKLTLRARFTYFASVGERHMAFYVAGVNYLTKMTTDLRFLPAPSQQDPLLLHWFGEQVPWILASDPALRAVCIADVDNYRAKGEADGASPALVAQLAQAQKELLEESARNGTLVAPSAIVRHAVPPPPDGAEDDGVDAGARWQWAALQTLLYGSECYAPLLNALPKWFTNRELAEAAVVVQQQYRNRLARRLARVRRQAAERKKVMDGVARAKMQLRAAACLQGQWRGFVVRRAIKEAATENRAQTERKRTEHEQEIQQRKIVRDQRAREERAASCIQSRFKVLKAKKEALAKKQDAALQNSSASNLLAQTRGVTLLEKVLTRHRASNAVMWETYEIVCLSYETQALEQIEESLRGSRFHASLQGRLVDAEREQYEHESKLRTAMMRQAQKELKAEHAPSTVGTAAPKETTKAKAAKMAGAFSAKADSANDLINNVASSAKEGQKKKGNALKGQATLEEQAAAASRVGPDGLPRLDVLRMYRDAFAAQEAGHLQCERLSTEVNMWTSYQKMREAAGPLDVAALRRTKEERAQQALLATREMRAAEVQVAQAEKVDEFTLLIDSGGERSALPVRLVVDLIDGADEELSNAANWGIPMPQVAGQRALWGAARKKVKDAHEAVKSVSAEAMRKYKESMKRDGANAPTVELCRLLDRVDKVKGSASFLQNELTSGGASLKMRERAAKLYEDAEPPMPSPPTNPTDKRAWKAYVADVVSRASAFEAEVHAGQTLRAAAAAIELTEAKERCGDQDLLLKVTKEHVRAWLRVEGQLRVLTSLQSPERFRLGRVLLGKRSEAYRKMCVEPVDTKLKYRAATRELAVVTEAEELADEIDASDVQHRTYREAHLTLRVLDGRDAPLELLIGNPTAQEALAGALMNHLGCLRDDRLFVSSAKRVELIGSYSTGDVIEPGTEVVVNVRREEGNEKSPTELLQQISTMHELGQLGEVLGVNRDSIKMCEASLAKEDVREAPTLVQLRAESELARDNAQKRYDESLEMKPMHKAQLRTWHRMKGALLHLRRLEASKLVDAAKAKKHGDGNGADADETQNGETHPQFLARWMGVRDILRSKLAVLAAISERDVRTRMKTELIRMEGRLQLLDVLQEGCMDWPEVHVTVQHECVKIDRRWNLGLAKPEQDVGGREPETVEEMRKCGRFCYFCAGLEPQVRVQHRMVDCPKRRRANAREYRPETMEAARATLRSQRSSCEAKLAEHRAATEAVRAQKQALLELAGAIKVLGAQEGHKPPPASPSPPPTGERLKSWRQFMRRRCHQQTMVMKTIARGSKEKSMFSHVPSAWGELKAVALMMPQPRVLEGPISPAWLFECAEHLELDISSAGSDHLLLPFVIGLARAPLPPHWYPVSAHDVPKEELVRNPKWLEPPPSDEFVYGNLSSARKGGDLSRELSASSSGQRSAAIVMAPAPAELAAPAGAPEAAPVLDVVPSFNLEDALRKRGRLDVYENAMTGERKHGHPGAVHILPLVRGMQVRAARALKPSPTDGWVQFVDAMGEPFFYSFRDKSRTAAFPKFSSSDVPRCVLPMRQLEPSAVMLCQMGETLIPPDLSYAAALAEARQMLYEPRKAARAVQLASNPCPLDELLMNAQYLGLSPADHGDFMFLVDAMLAPELPCGWLARAAPGMAEGQEYYWNMMLGWAQWEHPQISLLTGVANDLKKRQRDHEQDEHAREGVRMALSGTRQANVPAPRR